MVWPLMLAGWMPFLSLLPSKSPPRSSFLVHEFHKTDLTSTRKSASVTKEYPDIDSVFYNAGLQRQSDFASPKAVDIAEFHQQIHVNYIAAVSLVHAFLPFLLGKTGPTSIIL